MPAVRVCEVAKTLDLGGVETLLVDRLRRAPGRRVRYSVVCLRASSTALIAPLRAAGIEVVNLGRGPRPLVYARLVAVLRRLRPDVLNVHSPVPAAVSRLAVRLGWRRPLVVSTVHNTRYRPLTMLVDRLTRSLDDHTIAVAPGVARAATVRGARRLTVRVHGVDVAEQRAWAGEATRVRREFGVPEGAFLVVNVANLRPAKNHSGLVRAAARVVSARPDAYFLLAGSGPRLRQVADEVQRSGRAGRVRLLGPVPHAARLIAAADLLVLASHHEGLPVVVMEALAAGVPVVATRVGGVPDLVTSGHNGLLVPPGDMEALAAAVVEAMRPETHRALRAGAGTSAAGLDIAGTARWFEDFYADLVGVR